MRRHRNTLLYITIIITFVIIGGEAIGGKLYKWVDDKGSVHFSDRLPDGAEISEESFQEEELKEVLPDKQTDETRVNFLVKGPIEYATACTFTIKGSQSLGTGFFISSNGYAVTCKHVIEEGRNHRAILNNQDEFPVGVISTSDKHDLALVLVITSQKTPYLSFGDLQRMTPGEQIFAIGSSIGLQSTVTDGVYTGVRKKMPAEDLVIQFSAPINPGNSGGPLVDGRGQVLGVVSWKIVANKGVPVMGVGFAVPAGYLIEEYGGYIE